MKGGKIMMKMYYDYFKTLVNSKKGQGMVEYGLIISLIAVAVIGSLAVLGPKIAELFGSVESTLTSASSSTTTTP
jgi:pilus assembly protein Flp/PilA